MRRSSFVVPALALGFLVAGAGASSAGTDGAFHPDHGARLTQCNGDPSRDPSNDPVHCHYAHPFDNAHWWRHRHHHEESARGDDRDQ
jgi:hypothetical protein